MSNKIVESERYERDHSSQAVPYILMECRRMLPLKARDMERRATQEAV